MFSVKHKKESAFTLVEILIVIAILAILAVVTFVVINPAQRINDANDARRREDAQNLLSAISLYAVDNAGAYPTQDGDPLPQPVTSANIMANGAAATDLDGISPDYVSSIPVDPSGAEYRVGLQANNAAMVGIVLSDGTTVFTATE